MDGVVEMATKLASQGDRVLFLLCLGYLGWLWRREQRRSDSVQADLLKDNHESRERYHSNLNELQGRLFEQTKEVTEVVATNTAILTRVEKKL
jgi:hypothetical protein